MSPSVFSAPNRDYHVLQAYARLIDAQVSAEDTAMDRALLEFAAKVARDVADVLVEERITVSELACRTEEEAKQPGGLTRLVADAGLGQAGEVSA